MTEGRDTQKVEVVELIALTTPGIVQLNGNCLYFFFTSLLSNVLLHSLRLGPEIDPPVECVSSTTMVTGRTNSHVTLVTSSFVIIIADIRQTKFGPEIFMNVRFLKEVSREFLLRVLTFKMLTSFFFREQF